jgi:non-homologous end joining protein Ku
MCNIGGLVSFKETDIDIELLKKAVNRLIENSDAIRTVISNEEVEPQQYAKEYKYEDVEVIKISSHDCKKIFEEWIHVLWDTCAGFLAHVREEWVFLLPHPDGG